MRFIGTTIKKHAIKLLVVGGIVVAIYFYLQTNASEDSVMSAVVVEQVARGEVTSGIETTGKLLLPRSWTWMSIHKQPELKRLT